MLYLYLKESELPNPINDFFASWFNSHYTEEWVTTEFASRVIKEIDKCKLINWRFMDSEVLGAIPVRRLSGGSKTLIMIEQQVPYAVNSSSMGDNCAPYLEYISNIVDVHMYYKYAFKFTDTQVAIYPNLNNLKVVGDDAIYRERAMNYDKRDY